MQKNGYTVKELKPGVWRVEEFNLGTVYVVRGSERGLLIDTGTGVGDLKGHVEELIDTPYDVVLTHGHGDHAGGTHQFERFYVHRKDVKMALSSNLESRKNYAKNILDTYPESKGLFDPEKMTVEVPRPEAVPFADGWADNATYAAGIGGPSGQSRRRALLGRQPSAHRAHHDAGRGPEAGGGEMAPRREKGGGPPEGGSLRPDVRRTRGAGRGPAR